MTFDSHVMFTANPAISAIELPGQHYPEMPHQAMFVRTPVVSDDGKVKLSSTGMPESSWVSRTLRR